MQSRLCLYLVMQYELDYDGGEAYTVCEGGFPVALFVDEAAAKKHAEKLQKKWEAELDGDEVFYDYNDEYADEPTLPFMYSVKKVFLYLDDFDTSTSLIESVLNAQPSEHERVLLAEKCCR